MTNFPMVTFVIPTLNEEKFLNQCLQSIRSQNYPRESIEIIIADGGSTDATQEIAEKNNCIILQNPEKLAEPGKQLAFSKATGKYIALLDADNEIARSDWLSLAIKALEQHPDALGFESYYLKKTGQSLLNRYLTAILQISDPCAKKMAGHLKIISCENNIQVFALPANGSYPTGANGFIFRKELLSRLQNDHGYHEATFFPRLIRDGTTKLIKIKDCGIYHYYVKSLSDFYRKRQRAMIIYMIRKETKENNWDSGTSFLHKFLVLLYNATFIGPAIEGIFMAIFKADSDWLIHPVASFVSVIGSIKGILGYYLLAPDDKVEYLTTKMSDINRL